MIPALFDFKLDHDGMMPGRHKDDTFNFLLHTVLQSKDNDGHPIFLTLSLVNV